MTGLTYCDHGSPVDIVDAVLTLDQSEDARLNAIIDIRCALFAEGLSLDDLAERIFWGATPPRGTLH